jgi:hypothetical protein
MSTQCQAEVKDSAEGAREDAPKHVHGGGVTLRRVTAPEPNP